MRSRRVSSVSAGLSSQTPTIIIRLTSLSMRSHAVSTRDMRSVAQAGGGAALRHAGDAVHRVSRTAAG
jgi:hypothetical protein